jgi:tetratricopeptide (TPR) repeat protein
MERVVSHRAVMSRRWRTTAMIGGLSLLCSCGLTRTDKHSWRKLLTQAEQMSREGKNEKAVKAAQDALADAENDLGPESPEITSVLVRLSHIYEAAGDVSQLAEMEKRLSAIKSKDFETWLVLGTLLHAQEKPLKAEEALKKALALKPDSFEAERELAMVEQDLGHDKDAVKLFEKGIKKNPQGYLYISLANSDMRLGRFAEAKEAFAQAKKINVKDTEAYIQEGYFHLARGESAQAEKSFKSAIAVDAASPFGYHHMGAYLAARQQYPEAEKYFRRALEMLEANPNTKSNDLLHTLNWLGIVIQSQGRSADAEVVLRKCLEMKAPPNGLLYVDCLLSLGMVYTSQNKNAEAEETFRRAVASYEDGSNCLSRRHALIGFGAFLLEQGRRREALDRADQAGKLCAGYKPIPGELGKLLELAELYVDLGRFSKGKALYRQILLMGQSRPFDLSQSKAMMSMADLDMTQSRFHEAEDLYRQAIPILEYHRDVKLEVAALDDLAAAYEKQGKLQEAGEARGTAKALKAQP